MTKNISNADIDRRHPTFKGFWKKSIPYKDQGFAEDNEYEEPHKKRRRVILKKYPHIKKLFGPSDKTKYIIFAMVIAHSLGMYLSTKIQHKAVFALFCYVYGGSLTALSGIVIHECTHGLASLSSFFNDFLGNLGNLPIILPIYGSFTKYHLRHHKSMGVLHEDPDLPLEIEYKLVKGNTILKCFYLLVYPFLYLGRSINTRKMKITKTEICNVVFHISALFAYFYFFGRRCLIYLTLSTYFGYSIHPAAAHLIQEHFTFKDGQETYSYYGPFNRFFINIGYHNEHHDFANVAWDNLPKIKKIAPEFYDCFYFQTSWFGVFYIFLTQATLGPQSRCARTAETHQKGMQKLISEDFDQD